MPEPRTRTKRGGKKAEDLLTIPAFLLAKNRPKAARRSDDDARPVAATQDPTEQRLLGLDAEFAPGFADYVRDQMRRGLFNAKWLQEKDVLGVFHDKFRDARERAERAEEARERRVERLRRADKTPHVLRGLISLTQVLRDMGAGAPRRRDAKEAIAKAGLEHVRWHFQPGEVTLARVKRVLAEYRPPERKPRGLEALDYPDDAVITFTGKNPKKPGSSAHERWEFLRGFSGRQLHEYVSAGGNPTTLRNAIKMGHARVTTDGKSKEEPVRADANKVPGPQGGDVRAGKKAPAQVAPREPTRAAHAGRGAGKRQRAGRAGRKR